MVLAQSLMHILLGASAIIRKLELNHLLADVI